MMRQVIRLFCVFAVIALSALPAAAQNPASQRIAAGGFSRQERSITGNWRIERASDGVYLVLSDDFRTRSAPDLKFFLSERPAAQVTANNATDGLFIAELPSARGGQRIRLPASLDVSQYQSLVLHCEQYSVLWGGGDLR